MSTAPVVVLALLALLLAGPVPLVLVRARWPLHAPRAALVLWQSIAAAAVLSAFGAGLAIASRLLVIDGAGRPTTSPTSGINALGLTRWLLYVFVLALTLVVGARLVITLVRVSVRTRRLRERHRDLVDLLDTEDVPELYGRAADLRVLAVAEPLAYCLPGLRSRVVLSDATLTALEPEELRAVLAHERAHLRARHDLVLEAFLVLHTAFPRGVRSESALAAVRLLVELLADDAAVRRVGPRPLAGALVVCAGRGAAGGVAGWPLRGVAGGGPATLTRVQRLADQHGPRRVTAGLAYLVAVLILVVPTLAVALPWITEISALLSELPRP